MNLRTKTLLAVALTLFAAGLLTFGVSYLVFTRSLRGDAGSLLAGIREQSARDAKDTLAQFDLVLASELDGLAQRVAQLTPRDDTWAYARTRSAAWRAANLPDAMMEEQLLSVVVLATEEGAVVHRLYYDWDRRVFDRLPLSVEALVRPGAPLQQATGLVSGFLELPEGILLLCAAPILPATRAGEPRGVLLFGRFLDPILLSGIEGKTAATVTLGPADAANPPAEGVFAEGEGFRLRRILRDLDGRALRVAELTPRAAAPTAEPSIVAIARTAETQALWLGAALLATLLLVTGVVLLHLELTVHRRTAELGARLDAIAADPKIGERVEVRGDDELGLLETSVNEVLAALETSRRDHAERARVQEASARRARASLQATGQVAFEIDTGAGRVHLEGAVSRLTGHTAEELASLPISAWEAMIHPEDRHAALAAADQPAGGPYRVEYRLKKKDGEWAQVEERGVRAPGTPARVVGILRPARVPSAPGDARARPES